MILSNTLFKLHARRLYLHMEITSRYIGEQQNKSNRLHRCTSKISQRNKNYKNISWSRCPTDHNSIVSKLEGCILSLLHYSEQVFRRALDGTSKGIKVNGEVINNIRYADDTVVLANNIDELQKLMERVQTASEKTVLGLNLKKNEIDADR